MFESELTVLISVGIDGGELEAAGHESERGG
jgi:hypothetical protein